MGLALHKRAIKHGSEIYNLFGGRFRHVFWTETRVSKLAKETVHAHRIRRFKSHCAFIRFHSNCANSNNIGQFRNYTLSTSELCGIALCGHRGAGRKKFTAPKLKVPFNPFSRLSFECSLSSIVFLGSYAVDWHHKLKPSDG